MTQRRVRKDGVKAINSSINPAMLSGRINEPSRTSVLPCGT